MGTFSALLALCDGNPPVTHKGQWRGALMFSWICAWKNGWANNRDAGVLGRHRAYYDVTVMNAPQQQHNMDHTGITNGSNKIDISWYPLPFVRVSCRAYIYFVWALDPSSIEEESGQYHGCWCPGSSRRQAISSHGIASICRLSQWTLLERISMTCHFNMENKMNQ